MPILPGAEHTLRTLQEDVELVLKRLGIMYRVFGREKSRASIEKKVLKKGYRNNGRLLQDLIGIRVVVYFSEDCEIVHRAINDSFDVAEEAVDQPETHEFGPRRLNLVIRVGDSKWDVAAGDLPIDRTFELQIRTVLSEGWHEVEHDLRYKCAEDWVDSPCELRTLNGTLGALETAEWAMVSIFDGLAYSHYKAKNWEAMLRHKFRLRLQDGAHLHQDIDQLLTEDAKLAKCVWRAERANLLNRVASSRLDVPWTFDNLVYLILAVEDQKHSVLANLRPKFIARRIDEAFVGRQ